MGRVCVQRHGNPNKTDRARSFNGFSLPMLASGASIIIALVAWELRH
jgi:hypothetical protein